MAYEVVIVLEVLEEWLKLQAINAVKLNKRGDGGKSMAGGPGW